MSGDYHGSRLTEDRRRGQVWRALWRCFFRHRIRSGDCVLDIGAGYGDFINAVAARRRIAIDRWAALPDHVDRGVEAIVGPLDRLGELPAGSIDYAFASNLVEHLDQPEFIALLGRLTRLLSPGGTLTLLQPNYRYAYRDYFDDYTHVAVYSHISLADLMRAHGWDVVEVRPRFLPLTVKSRLPVWTPLIAAYLASPVKPMGKQMLVVARPRRTA